MIDPRLSPARLIDKLNQQYPRELAFSAKNAEETILWQKRLRPKLEKILGGFPEKKGPLSAKIIKSETESKMRPDGSNYAYKKETITFEAQPGEEVLSYFLTPDDSSRRVHGKFPCVICVAGHGMGADSIIGYQDDGTERKTFDGYQRDFALQCVSRGYSVFVVEQMAIGHRRTSDEIKENPRRSTCGDTFHELLLFGKTLIGVRTYDVIRAIDYLYTRTDIDSDHLSILGVSGGGTTSLFTAALDERIKCILVSGYLNSFSDTLMVNTHCACNYIPGILKYCEFSDIAGLVAPRPMFFEVGDKDSTSPIASVRKTYSEIQKIYGTLGAKDRLQLSVFEGPHEFNGKDAFKFLDQFFAQAKNQH